jgi:hypothetical protein
VVEISFHGVQRRTPPFGMARSSAAKDNSVWRQLRDYVYREKPIMTTTTVPVTVLPEAATRVTELGMQAELERMLEHTRHTVPGLRAIEVQLALPYDTGEETTIIIEATRDHPHLTNDPTDMDWAAWKRESFPPKVWEHFLLMSVYGSTHAG